MGGKEAPYEATTAQRAAEWLAKVSSAPPNGELQRVQTMALERLRADNAELGARVTSLEDAKTQLAAMVEEATRLNTELARQAGTFKHNHERAMEDVVTLKARAETHEAERAALERAREELRALKAENATMAEQVVSLRVEAAELDAAHVAAASAHAVDTEKLGVATEKLGVATENGVADRAATEIAQEELRAAKAEITKLVKEVEELKSAHEGLVTVHADSEIKHVAVLEKLGAVSKEHETLMSNHAAVMEKLAAVNEEHETLVSKHVAVLEKLNVVSEELLPANAEITKLTKQVEELKSVAEGLIAVNENAEIKRAAVLKQLDAVNEELRSANAGITKLTKEVEELKSAAEGMVSVNADAEIKHAAVLEKLGAVSEKHETLVSQHAALQAKLSTKNDLAAEKSAELATAKADLAAAKEKIGKMEKMAKEHGNLTERHAELNTMHDALLAKSRIDASAISKHVAETNTMEAEKLKTKTWLAECQDKSKAGTASVTEERAANANAQREAELSNTRALTAEVKLESLIKNRGDQMERLKVSYESEKDSLREEIGTCMKEVEKLHGTHLEHIEATKQEKAKIISANGVLDSELRDVRNQHIKFVAEAIDVITLLNIAHGFSPKIGPSGKIEVADMAKQLREA
jgi:chromosome segregation ATPase